MGLMGSSGFRGLGVGGFERFLGYSRFGVHLVHNIHFSKDWLQT